MTMELTVNGATHQVDSPPLTTLLDVLREELDITGPKVGCESGGCGACTVLIDGDPRRSCLTAICMVDGNAITTVEGLGGPDNLSEVQKAFVHHYAAQCGFCTDGMVTAATAYVNNGGSPAHDDIREAIGGHFCRCTGYVKILDAIAAAARGDTFDTSATAETPNTTYVTIGSGGAS